MLRTHLATNVSIPDDPTATMLVIVGVVLAGALLAAVLLALDRLGFDPVRIRRRRPPQPLPTPAAAPQCALEAPAQAREAVGSRAA